MIAELALLLGTAGVNLPPITPDVHDMRQSYPVRERTRVSDEYVCYVKLPDGSVVPCLISAPAPPVRVPEPIVEATPMAPFDWATAECHPFWDGTVVGGPPGHPPLARCFRMGGV